jgi:thioredoxin-dependent peroxiredoxin
MAKITLKGSPIHTLADLPAAGSTAPAFVLTDGELADRKLSEWKGRAVVLNIVPSLDTGVCAASARRFNKEIGGLIGKAVVLTVSRDLPFAQKRFCEAEGIAAVITLSEMRDRDFGKAYGVEMVDGPLRGLLSRAVVVIGPDGRVVHAQQVPEIAQEPDYAAAMQAVRRVMPA